MGSAAFRSRRSTNIGAFRAYVQHYRGNHPRIRQDMTLLVRQLQPSEAGLPLEIYAFTATVAWAEYEAIQADIFDHLLAILPEFGLRLFQQPGGADFRPWRSDLIGTTDGASDAGRTACLRQPSSDRLRRVEISGRLDVRSRAPADAGCGMSPNSGAEGRA